MSTLVGLDNNSPKAQNLQHNFMRGNNGGKTALDLTAFRAPDYFVHIFTVSKRAFLQLSPPLYPRLNIPACGPDERFRKVIRVMHPMQQVEQNPHEPSGEPAIYIHDGRRVAMNLCNPANTSLDQDLVLDPWYMLGVGNDLTRQGVFWSLNETPTEQELQSAEKRRDNYLQKILQNIDKLESSDPKSVAEVLTEDHHLACERFGEERSWHRAMSTKVVCPNCGDKIKQGVAFHKNDGILCVNDWERAYRAGAVKKADVPEGMEWWDTAEVDATPAGKRRT